MSTERYEIKGKIGQGGVGAVYQAYDTHLNREVAIKRVLADGGYENQEEATKNLLKEATALSSVQHPHIVTVYDAGVDDDGPYVVMELIHGRTLDEMVERAPLTWNDLREVILQTQEALIAAQDLDLVHRDLKPSNLMVCWLASGKFQVKIVDFGLAKFSATPSLQTIDHGDAVFGSIFFMAPEQFERTPLDKRTDMYAMGCLYYYALTGEYPFTGETAAAVMASHLQHHVIHLREARPDIPQWGADWIMWHIEHDLDDRPDSAREALERFLILDKQSTQPITVNAASSDPNKPKFIFPDAAEAPAQPATAPVPTTAPVQPTTAPQPSSLQNPETTPELPNPQTAPQPITPPGAETSPHTKSENVTAQAAPPQPEVKPTPAPAAALPTTPAQPESLTTPVVTSVKKSMPNGAKIAIASMLALVIIVAIVILTSLNSSNNETTMVNEIMLEAKGLNDEGTLQNGISLTEEGLKATLNRATSTEDNKQRPLLLKTLAFTKAKGDYSADEVILEHITTAQCPENLRAEFIKVVMSRRKNLKNVAPLLEFAKYTDETDSATQAIHAARISAEGHPADKFIQDFLSLINDTGSASVRGAAERAASSLIAESSNKTSFTTPIYGSYQSAVDDGTKFSMLRLLGSTGGDKAAEVVTKALKSNKSTLQSAAIAALGIWPDDTQFEKLIEFITECENEAMRKKAYTAAYNFLRLDRKRDADDLAGLWKSFTNTAETRSEKRQIIQGMTKQRHAWAIHILELFTEDDDNLIADKSQQAKEYLEKRIRKQGSNDDE